jgi:hypothetical protein
LAEYKTNLTKQESLAGANLIRARAAEKEANDLKKANQALKVELEGEVSKREEREREVEELRRKV